MPSNGPTQGNESGKPADEAISTDDIFHLLQNARRRQVLRHLSESDGPIDLRDLAERIAAWEHDTPVDELSSTQRQRIYIALYQSHLPKLHDHGVVRYDQHRGTVERTSLASQLEIHLDPGMADQPTTAGFDSTLAGRMAAYAIGATVVCILLTGATWARFVPGTIAVTIVTAFVAGLTLMQIASPRIAPEKRTPDS